MAEKDKKEKKGVIKTLADFDKTHKSAIVDVRALAKNSGFWSSGSLALDKLTNGGLPKGTMVEYFGKPQSGKSTAACKAGGMCLAAGGSVAYIDLERGLDLVNESHWTEDGVIAPDAIVQPSEEHVKRRQSWLRTNGINPFHPNFRVIDPEDGEHMFSILGDIITSGIFDIVIVDSVAAIITRAEAAGEAGESHYGQVAKLLSTELKRMLSLYRNNHNTTVIFINQVRDKIGFMQKGQKSTGGHALEHFVGTKIEFTKIGRKEVGEDIETETLVQVEKSRYASARQITLKISGARGLDTLAELYQFGLDFGYIHTSGSWHSFFEVPMSAEDFKAAKEAGTVEELSGFVAKVGSRALALDFMAENGWQDKLFPLALKAG